jgi:hypothetical protein
MASLNHTNAIVFDLWDNRGGYSGIVSLLAAYLFDHKFFRPGGLPALAGRGVGLQVMVDNRYRVNAGSVFSLKYHLVWCPKYRKRILVNAPRHFQNALAMLLCIRARLSPNRL